MNGIFLHLAKRARSGIALLPILVLVLALAGDAEAQASRTRSGGSSGSQSGSVSRSAGSGGSTAAPAPPASQRSGGTVTRTRPAQRPGGGPVVVEDDRRPPGDRGWRGYYPYYPYSPWGNPWWSPYYVSWGSRGWYGAYGPYGLYGGAYYPGPVRTYSRRATEDMGAFDMDLSPGDTQIWIDGEYVGIADRYDGWPQYLWLREGTYRFVFYREGYSTLVREYTVRPGLVIDVEDRLDRGESTPPEELFPPMPTPNRDARLRRNQEQREAARAPQRDDRRGMEPEEGREDWRQRGADVRDGRDERRAADFGSVRLRVDPPEAAVYLDGRLVGTGEELARLRRGLAVEAGFHRIQVIHPDHPAGYETELDVEAGQELDLDVTLGG